MKQQFNINLDSDLVRRTKHHAIDAQLSLSDLVDQVLTEHLRKSAAMTDAAAPDDIVLQPLVHVRDTAGTLAAAGAPGGPRRTRQP